MNSAQTSFGHRLREARERRGLSLDAIAASTKINGSLFAELERGDLKHWPSAIFRRAFFREYTSAIGLDPEPLLPDFLRLFPEDPSAQADTSVRIETPRMALAPGRTWTAATASRRAASALAELAAIVAFGAAVGPYATGNIWTSAGIVGLLYWTVSTAVLGQGALGWFVERQTFGSARRPTAASRLRIVPKQAASMTLETAATPEVARLRAVSR